MMENDSRGPQGPPGVQGIIDSGGRFSIDDINIRQVKGRKFKDEGPIGLQWNTRVNAIENINAIIRQVKGRKFKDEVIDNISDGYHTFGELYDFRLLYNAALFNEWAKQGMFDVHKSYKHYDGEWCFGEEGKWFIVSAMLPTGLISNHYKSEHWNLFNVKEEEKAIFEFDGHTAGDVRNRLKQYLIL